MDTKVSQDSELVSFELEKGWRYFKRNKWAIAKEQIQMDMHVFTVREEFFFCLLSKQVTLADKRNQACRSYQ